MPLTPRLVVEVCYDHFTGDRFRHGARLLRWRPDKAPLQCTLAQVKQQKAKLMALLDESPASLRRAECRKHDSHRLA
jgi:ATP-dependent DNA ligase